MQNSIQISTGPLLKQFATRLSADEIALTSKLGTSTVSRIRFKRLSYPNDIADQEEFVTSLVDNQNPTARQELLDQFYPSICDQVKALNLLLGISPPP